MSQPSSPRGPSRVAGSRFHPRLSVALIIVALFVGTVFLSVRSPSRSAPTTTTIPSPSHSSTGSATTHPPVQSNSSVRVQVANGTNITALAAAFTQTLMTQNWDTLPPDNGPHVAATTIYYNRGYHRAALKIASAIKVSASAVHPLNGANPVPGSSNDDVIVVLGPNSAHS